MKRLFFFIIFLLSIASAFSFTPQDDMNLRNEYAIWNATNITAGNVTADYLIGDGGSITGISGTVDATDNYSHLTSNVLWFNTSFILLNLGVNDSNYSTYSGTATTWDSETSQAELNVNYSNQTNNWDSLDSPTDFTTVGTYSTTNYYGDLFHGLWGNFTDFIITLLNVTDITVTNINATYGNITDMVGDTLNFTSIYQGDQLALDRGDSGTGISISGGLINLDTSYTDARYYNSSEANSTFLMYSNESDLNVNYSNYTDNWDSHDTPYDITDMGNVSFESIQTGKINTSSMNTTTINGFFGSDCGAGEYLYGRNTDGSGDCRVDQNTGGEEIAWTNDSAMTWTSHAVNITGHTNMSTAELSGNFDMNTNNIDAIGSLTNYYGTACGYAINDIADDGTFTCQQETIDSWTNDSTTVSTSDNVDVTGDFNLTGNIYMTDDNTIGIPDAERIVFDSDGGEINIMGAQVSIGTLTPLAGRDLHIYSSNPRSLFLERSSGSDAYTQIGNTEHNWTYGLRYSSNSFFISNASYYADAHAKFVVSAQGIPKFRDIAAAAGTDYVCIDTNGDLSSGATCTQFENIEDYPEHINEGDIKIIDVKEMNYPDDHPIKANQLHNYYYEIAFNDGTKTVKGEIKVPRTADIEEEVLYYLKMKIQSYRNQLPQKKVIQSDMKGKTYVLKLVQNGKKEYVAVINDSLEQKKKDLLTPTTGGIGAVIASLIAGGYALYKKKPSDPEPNYKTKGEPLLLMYGVRLSGTGKTCYPNLDNNVGGKYNSFGWELIK